MSEWVKCDSCPAQAQWLARGTEGELAFCTHHRNKLSEGLDKWSYEMIELNKVEQSPKLTEEAVN